ncbi:MAG TPA: hypothetical protein VGQ93_03945, partial [Lysobacter sp.]|nr:hypothetical protein [Lysobacter sp.]
MPTQDAAPAVGNREKIVHKCRDGLTPLARSVPESSVQRQAQKTHCRFTTKDPVWEKGVDSRRTTVPVIRVAVNVP